MAAEATPKFPCVLLAFQETREYLRVSGEAATPEDKDRAVTEMITMVCKGGQLSMAEASKLIEVVNHESLDSARRNQVIQAVNKNVVGASRKTVKERQENQVCWHFHKYCNAEFWAEVSDPEANWQKVAQTVSGYMEKLGLLWPTDPTILQITCAIVLARAPPNQSFMANPMDIYNKKDAIKKEYKLIRKSVKMPHHGLITHYPETPSEIKALSEVVYENAFPSGSVVVPSPVEDVLVNRLRMRMACRSNHSAIKDHRALNVSSGAEPFNEAWAPGSARQRGAAKGRKARHDVARRNTARHGQACKATRGHAHSNRHPEAL